MPRQPILNRGRPREGRTTRFSPRGAGLHAAALSLVRIPAVDFKLLGAVGAVAVGVIARIATPLV